MDKKNVWTNILPCKVKNKIENMKFSLTMSNLSYQIKTPYIPEIENRFFKIHNSTDIIIQHLCVNSGILYNQQYIYCDSKLPKVSEIQNYLLRSSFHPPKIPTENYRFLPYPLIDFQGRNLCNFWLGFWEK